MIPKPLSEVEFEDIVRLVENKTPEGRTLEYKEALPGQTDEAKREFVFDIASFANASGGDIIFGVEDERDSAGKPTGIPKRMTPLAVTNLSAETLRLDSLVQSCIEPRIIGIERKVLDSNNEKIVLIRVPKSWSAPHMSRISGVTRFYTRSNDGKYLMDVGELRLAFNLSSSLPERLEKLRLERLGRIAAGDAPSVVAEGPKMVLHLVPIGALESVSAIDIGAAPADLQTKLQPMGAGAWSHRINFDGYLTHDPHNETYVQLYRSGMLEAVAPIGSKVAPPEWKNSLPSLLIERELLQGVTQYIQVLRQFGIFATNLRAAFVTRSKGQNILPHVESGFMAQRRSLTEIYLRSQTSCWRTSTCLSRKR